MRVLFIGGNGNISAACSRLCLETGTEVFLLNRGRRDMPIRGAHNLVADINDPDQVRTMDRYIAAWRKACSAGRQGGVGGEPS